MKTNELTGAALDWAVAKCEWHREKGDWLGTYRAAYSTDWTQGGLIIEREKISIINHNKPNNWVARTTDFPPIYYQGPTLLIAAMRCYVTSKLGDEVDVPEELLK